MKPKHDVTELSTERLWLRPFRLADLPHVQRYAIRPDFYRYLPIAEQTPETVAAFFHARLNVDSEEPRMTYILAIEPYAIGHIVGAVRLQIQDWEHRQGDLGFCLDSDYSGRGYGTEAINRLIRFGFDRLKLHRIWAMADTDNDRSCALLERVGMVREGRLRDDKLVRGEWRSSCLYAILASDVQP